MTSISFTGVLRVREIPREWSKEDFEYWWLPEVNAKGRVLRAPRMSHREKDRYTVYEARNLLTNAGRTQLFTYIANGSGASAPFGKIFSIGANFALVEVTPDDTAVVGEIGRVIPSTPIIVGTQVDIPCLIGSSQFPGLWSNVGLYGTSSATTTLGTGSLFTHALFAYNKVNGVAVTVDYLVNLQ